MAPLSRNNSSVSSIGQPGAMSAPAAVGPPGGPIEIVFTFDTTGSMYGCLKEVRQKIKEIIGRLFADIPNLRIAVFAHGDYCDKSNYVTKYVDFTNDAKKLCDFVQKVKATGGGDWEECYELVLRQSRELLSWTPGTQRALVMIGDAIPHPPSDPQNKDNIDWKVEVQKLRDEMAVRVYSVQAYESAAAKDFWQSLAKMSYGKHLNLGQFETIVDMMMAICYREHGTEFFEAYEREVRAREGAGIRKELDRMFDTLRDGDGGTSVAARGSGIVSTPIAPSRPSLATPVGKGGALRFKAGGKAKKPKGVTKSKSCLAAKRILKRAVKGAELDTTKYTLGKQFRETVSASNNQFRSLEWTRWRPAMAATTPASGATAWQPRRMGAFGFRNTSLFCDELDVPAVYEMAVQVNQGQKMYPVCLRSMASTNHAGHWDRYLLRNSEVNRKVSSVLQKGCKLYVRRAKLETPVNCNGHLMNTVQELKKLMKDTYDYAWSKKPYQKSCRRLERKGVIISE